MTTVKKYLNTSVSLQSIQRGGMIFVFVLVGHLITGKVCESSDMHVVPDTNEVRLASQNISEPPSEETKLDLTQTGEENDRNLVFLQKGMELRRTTASVDEEEQLMEQIVQTLDRGSAAQWLATFISSKPWDCPIKQRNKWIEAILYAVERNQLPICKEILGLVTSLISIESGFHADPLVAHPSRPYGMESLLNRAEKKLFEKFGRMMIIPPVPKYYAEYKNKYWPQLLACHTTSDVETIARHLADDLKKDSKDFPAPVKDAVNKNLGKLGNVVRSKGSMQVKLLRARPALKNRGEEFSDQELTEYMYTTNGGVDVGVAVLKPIFVQYAAQCAERGELSWLFFVGMDYHYGPFASRNMMEQIRIRDLSGQKIALDGSFLNHDEDGIPETEDSETLAAAVKAFPAIQKQKFTSAFLLEREPNYAYTDVHRLIVEAHKKRFGETPFAVIGEIKMGETAEVKFGGRWTTNLYLNKLDHYLNLIPWDN
ncbi:MAG TPA: DUF1615 family protein [Desulfomonilaceae bacterium]|nr:DUF1615 family protein [Desulfomonilaceae bacterium]